MQKTKGNLKEMDLMEGTEENNYGTTECYKKGMVKGLLFL